MTRKQDVAEQKQYPKFNLTGGNHQVRDHVDSPVIDRIFQCPLQDVGHYTFGFRPMWRNETLGDEHK